jgi:hypothetical protein
MSDLARYSIVIEWSPGDVACVVILPEWSDRYAMPAADGDTPQSAVVQASNARE